MLGDGGTLGGGAGRLGGVGTLESGERIDKNLTGGADAGEG